MITTIIQVVFLVSAIALAALVLLQQSKSGGLGASFGGGSSSSVFGARGAGDFLYSTTRILATVFFLSAIALSYSQNKAAHSDNILERSIQKADATLDIPSVNKENTAPVLNTDIPTVPKEEKPKAP